MAELDDKLLKTLDQTLQNMNTHLQNLESTLRGVKGGIDATFNPAIIKSFSDEIRGLKAARIIDADKSVAEVNKVYSAIQELSYMVKTGMKLEPVSLEQLDQYKKRLEEIDKLLEPLAGKRGLKTDEYLQRSSLYRERDRLRDILDSENPVVPVPLKKEEIAAAVEMLKRYEEVYKNIRKGDQQRAVEIANIAAKERAADMQTAEAAVSQREQAERRKAEIARAWAEQEAREKAQREKMKTASEKAAADERTAIAEAEAKKKSEIAKAWAEQDRRRYEKDGDPLGEIAARKGLTGTLAALEDQTAVNEWRKQTAEEQKRIAKEEAEVEKQIKKEMAEEEKKLAAEEKQRYQDAVAANKAMTKAEDDLAEAKRKARTAESKAAYTEDTKQRIEEERKAARERAQQAKEDAAIQKKADAESMANQRRQIQIKSQLAAIDKNRIAITKQSSDREKALAAQQQADYRSLQSELSKLIARQKELNAVSQGSGRRAKDRLSTYTISESEKAMRRYADAVRNAHREQKKLGDETNKMLPTIQRLASAFGVAFSVRGLAQFGKKLIETRGEFEMQFVAMKQIIGDVDAATKIWNQTMQQALQSPFKAMQLVTYTKQLAAYRIETEKLFDTTKRLADVSAGLGVDMGRLILAYGQVKSANFLRASEVRQFTEAGVNIVGGLAKYFTELEGRAVGTAEVMERITKRMVLFSDVEAIFKRMTDEGGEFYNMQEIQADTVKGQIQKLHDAYDQMLNTIGQANQGVIRNFVDRLNDLVRNWQNVAYVLKWNVNWVTAFGAALFALSNKYLQGATTQTLWFSKALTGNSGVLLKEAGAVRLFGNEVGILTMKQRLGVVAVRSFQGAISALGNALRRFWPLIVFEGIVLLTERLTRASRELKRFREELEATTSDNVVRMKEEIRGYDTLIKKMKETTEGTMARKDVMDEISRRYGKYLDFIVSEKTKIEELAGAYDKVVSSIRNYTAEKIREEQQQKLEKGVYDEYQNLINKLSGSKVQVSPSEGYISISKEQARQIAKLIEERVKSNPKVQYEELAKVINQYLGIEGVGALYNSSITDALVTYAENYRKLGEELQNIRDDIEGTTPVFESEAEYEQYKKNVEEAKKEIAAQNDLYQQQVDLVKQKTEEQWKLDDEIAKLRLENEEKILEIRKEYGLISEGQYNDELARLHGRLDTYETDYNKRLAKALAESYGESWQTEKKEARDMYNFVVSTEQALQQGTSQRNKQLKESYKGFKESLEQYNAQYQAAINSGASKESLDKIQADIDFATLMMKAIELAAQLRGIDLSEKKTHTRTTHENASKLISLIKEMRSEYDKLSKSAYGYAKSEEKVRESYKDSVKEILGKAGITDYDFTTNEGMIKALEKVKSYATKLGKDAAAEVQKYIDQLETEIEINAQVKIRKDFAKQIEEMFSNYDLTIDLEKLNVPTDELVGIFNLDVTTLDELRRFVDDFYNKQIELGNNPTELVEQVEGYYKKIDEMEKKELRERLKTYSKYLAEGQVEALKIHLEELKKMAELDKLYEQGYFTDTQYKDISNKIRKETDEKLAKNDWQQFKESDFYVTMFEDMSRVSSESIDIMIKRLKSLRKSVNDLNPKQAKEIVKAIEKLEKAKLERSPLKSFLEDWKTAAKWRKDNDNLVKQLGFYASGEEYWSKEQDKQSKKVAELRLEYEELVKNGTPEDAADVKERLDFEEEELSRINEILEDRRQKLDQINQEQNEGYGAQQRVLAGLAQGAQYFSDLASTAGTISTEIMDMFDGVSDASKKLAKDIAEIAANVGILAGDIVKAIASEGTDVGSMIDGLVRTWNIIKGIFSASEYEINYTIEKSTNALKDLEFELERVRRARERAWDTHAYVAAQNELENNIYAQIRAYDAMLAAEEERKNKDEEQIRTWKQEREELFEQLEDERETLLKDFGGIGESEYRNAAQGFVDAWKSAFLETGDGLQGLQDHFDEFLNEWFVKQATMRVAGKMLEPLFRDIDNAVDKYSGGGTSVMMSELAKIRERFGIIAPQLSDTLDELSGLWGIGGEGGLSGLAAGIQGMTEEQANVLEAYWNSVRGYTANIDMNVSRIAQILGAGGDNTNPMLAQMTLVAQNTTAIRKLLDLVRFNGGDGDGIRVYSF